MKTLRAAWEDASVGALREAAYKLREHGDQRRIEAIHDGHLPSDVNPQPRVGNSPTVPRGEMGRQPSSAAGPSQALRFALPIVGAQRRSARAADIPEFACLTLLCCVGVRSAPIGGIPVCQPGNRKVSHELDRCHQGCGWKYRWRSRAWIDKNKNQPADHAVPRSATSMCNRSPSRLASRWTRYSTFWRSFSLPQRARRDRPSRRRLPAGHKLRQHALAPPVQRRIVPSASAIGSSRCGEPY